MLNALDRSLLEELRRSLVCDESVRAVLLRAEGRLFCAGADLAEVQTMGTQDEFLAYVDLINAVVNDLEALEVPVVAAVQAGAFGGGLEILLGTDVIVAEDSATFGLTEVKWATIPGAGGTQRLGRAIGLRRARGMLLTGQTFSATLAHELGLVFALVPRSELDDRAREIAEALARGPRTATACLKELGLLAGSVPIRDGLATERQVSELLYTTGDRWEGMNAFLERRTPVYTLREHS